ncbi:MAG: fibronectin type III domain-containing protein [Candidatus Firestonebacteria bacterium]
MLDGEASGSRYLRIHKASAEEPKAGSVLFKTVLAPGKYALWVAEREENPEAPGIKASGKVFSWKKMPGTIEVNNAGEWPITVVRSAEGLAIDRIAVSSDPSFDPRMESLTSAPAAVNSLTAETTPQSVVLKWKASTALNIARYDVHCGGSDDIKSLGNATVIGSTADCSFTDWGLKPGTEYIYRVVAIDSRGNSSEVSTLKVSTAAQPVQIISGEKSGDPSATQKITFTLEVKDEAPLMLWAKYRPAFVKDFNVAVEIDGIKAGNWKLRAPYRPMWWTLTAKENGPALEFVDKILADGKDVFTLAPGKHTITIGLNPKLADNQHVVLELKASNDHSFRPAGYDPRADFPKGPTHYN